MGAYSDLLDSLKAHRRNYLDQLDAELDRDIARSLGETHLAILAIEAVMAEPDPERTGPFISYGEDGYPV